MRTFYTNRLTAAQAELVAAQTTYLKLLGKLAEEYRIDTRDGAMQKIRRPNLTKFKNIISDLEAEIPYLEGKLNGGGVVNFVCRRGII